MRCVPSVSLLKNALGPTFALAGARARRVPRACMTSVEKAWWGSPSVMHELPWTCMLMRELRWPSLMFAATLLSA